MRSTASARIRGITGAAPEIVARCNLKLHRQLAIAASAANLQQNLALRLTRPAISLRRTTRALWRSGKASTPPAGSGRASPKLPSIEIGMCNTNMSILRMSEAGEKRLLDAGRLGHRRFARRRPSDWGDRASIRSGGILWRAFAEHCRDIFADRQRGSVCSRNTAVERGQVRPVLRVAPSEGSGTSVLAGVDAACITGARSAPRSSQGCC